MAWSLFGKHAKGHILPARYLMTILAFFGFFNLYALRVNLSVAIVAMVDPRADGIVSLLQTTKNNTFIDLGLTCPNPQLSSNTTSLLQTSDKFMWNSKLQGVILGSFFYGYIVTQIPGAWVAKRFGAKYPFGIPVLLSGIVALLIPVAAKHSAGALIAMRVLQGIFQGVCFASMHTLISLWAPPMERTMMVEIAYCGLHVGTAVSLVVSGALANSLGWESIFYLFGVSACLWFVLWHFLVFNSPATHPRISAAERDFIQSSIHAAKVLPGEAVPPVPWRQILTSLPVWAICVGQFGNNWGFFTLLTNIPTYFNKVLHFSLTTNGGVSALPYLALGVMMPICGLVADELRSKGIITTKNVRKSFHFFGQMIPAACLVAVGYVGCEIYGAVAVFVVAVGATSLSWSSFQVNHIDISPSYSGFVMGLANTLATIPGIVGPYIVGVITSEPPGQTLPQWRTVFFISAGIYVLSAVFYAIFADGEPQEWDAKRAVVIMVKKPTALTEKIDTANSVLL